MNNYYLLSCLRRDERVFLRDNEVIVDLRNAEQVESVVNDQQLSAIGKDPDIYFFVSGGGSYLIDNRFLLVVQRDLFTRVNPGKLSVFSGRSSSFLEQVDPFQTVRELFEEVTISIDSKVAHLINRDFQKIIDTSYPVQFNSPGIREIDIERIDLPATRLTVLTDEGPRVESMLLDISNSRELNCLWLFNIDVEVERFDAVDCEDNGNKRALFLIDVERMKIRPLSHDVCHSWDHFDVRNATSTLTTVLSSIRSMRETYQN